MNGKASYYVEYVIKTAVIVVIIIWSHSWIGDHMRLIEQAMQGTILAVLGLLLAGCVAGTFAFSYDKTDLKNHFDRYLGHLVTFFLNLGIGLLLNMTMWTLSATAGFHNDPIALVGLVVFVSILLYDLWDLHCGIRKIQN